MASQDKFETEFPISQQANGKTNFQSLLLSVTASADAYKERVYNVALSASEELRQMAHEQEPLWLFNANKSWEVLNEAEYKRRFFSLDATLDEIIRLISTGEPTDQLLPNLNDTANGAPVLQTGASRSIGIVLGSPFSIVNMLINVEQWSDAFSNIVSKATTLGVLLPGDEENHNEALQVIRAEFHLPSPLFTPQEVKFARFCRWIDSNTCLVADVSLESVFPNQAAAIACVQRRPSGCLIQQIQPGLSMVTWVENNVVQVHDGSVHDMFRTLLTSDFAFSAKRWNATLERYYDRMTALERQNDHFPQPNGLGAGNRNLLKLTQRMVKLFAGNVSPCSENSWVALPINSAEKIFVRTSMNLYNPGLPQGIAVTISTSVRLPIPQNNLFEFLRNGSNRNKWDLLSIGSNIRDEMRICSARDPTNSVALLSVESPATDKAAMLYLQESFTDSIAMYVVYAPVDVAAMQYLADGKDADRVSILPSGFTILPAGDNVNVSGSSILTISFQLMDEQLSSADYLPPISVLTANRIVRDTVSLIKTAFLIL